MADQAANILRRKAVSGRAKPITAAMTPEIAMKLAFGRAGRGPVGLRLRMTGFGMERASVAGLGVLVPEGGLIMTLRRMAPGTGVLIVDAEMTAALIEAETMGRVGKSMGESRRATRIDALIVGAFIDAALAQFDALAGELSIAAAVTGWRVDEPIGEAAAMPLLVEDVALRLFRFGFDFADGARAGKAWIGLPMEIPKPAPAPGSLAEGFARDLEHRVMAAQAEVQAVLARLALPLDTVSGWAPGRPIPLPRTALQSVRVEDIDGVMLARGKLGQVQGHRAVRLQTLGGDD